MATKKEIQLATLLLKERLERLTGKKVVLEEKLQKGMKISYERFKKNFEGIILGKEADIRPAGFNPDRTPIYYRIKFTKVPLEGDWKIGGEDLLPKSAMKNLKIL